MRKSSVERVSTKRIFWYAFGIIVVLVAIGSAINNKDNLRPTQLEVSKKSVPAAPQIEDERAASDDTYISPADFVNISIGERVRIKGIVKNLTRVSDVIMFSLEDKGKAVIVIALSDSAKYQNGKVIKVKGIYATTDLLNTMLGMELGEANVSLIMVD